MRADPRAVLDACVLANFGLCDLFLTLAENPPLHRPVWNSEILNEAQRTQIEKLGWPAELSRSWREAVESAFPEALVTGWEPLLPVCEVDEKDRHVLAAAVRSQADLIVTSNLRHFPSAALPPWRLVASHPGDYLVQLYSLDSGLVVARLEQIAEKRGRTPQTHLALLGRSVPAFAGHVAEALGWELPRECP